jgi:signal transduction histidine kinase
VVRPAVLRVGYIAVFTLTAIVCFVAISRARQRLDDPDTRWGLTALLGISGFWAAFQVGRLVVPGSNLKITFYILGLIVGLASVGAWLYFCSAYTNNSYHHQSAYRWIAVVLFVSIIGVKLTSPIHGLYFSTTVSGTPFRHLVIKFGAMHWIVTGLAYALSAIGFYMLFDLFDESRHATARLGLIVGLAGMPVILDLVGYLSPEFIVLLNYEPIGVGMFSIGVLYVADGRFVAVQQFGREQLLDELEEGVLLLDSDKRIRDVNTTAEHIFPALTDSLGQPIAEALPEIEAQLPIENRTIVEREGADSPVFFLVSATQLTAGTAPVGQALVFTDITEVERQRRQIKRQQSQFDEFADAITHELRNTINIVTNNLAVATRQIDPDSQPSTHESLTTAAETTDRMTGIVNDLTMLARYGHTVENTNSVRIEDVAAQAWAQVPTENAQLCLDTTSTIEADISRVETILTHLFEFGTANGATEMVITQTDTELVVTSNGQSLSEAEIESAFAFGEAVPDAETGMVFPVVRTMCEAHGWSVTIDSAYQNGLRVVISY